MDADLSAESIQPALATHTALDALHVSAVGLSGFAHLPVVLLLTLVTAVWAFRRFALRRTRFEGEPPIVPGLPFFGSARQFQNNSIELIHNSEKHYGPVFTLQLPFNYLHIVADVHAVEAFVKNRDLSFDPIQRMVNKNVFGFRLNNASGIIREAAHSAKASMLGKSMVQYNEHLQESYLTLGTEAWSVSSLKQVLIDTQFRAIFNSIFGRSDEHPFNHRNMREKFDTFHEAFLFLWLGFPLFLFPRAQAALNEMSASHPPIKELMARQDSSEYLRKALTKILEEGGTLNEALGHNLVYLHVNYNTVKITFWVICRLLENPDAMVALMEETNEFLSGRSRSAEGRVEVPMSEIERLPVLDSVVKETFRVSSGVVMVREVLKDTDLELQDGRNFRFRKGDKVAVYPPAIHMDPEIYEEPETFRYDRFIGTTFYKSGQMVRHCLLPYGTKCPGQRMSMLQIKLFLLSFVAYFEMEKEPLQAIPSFDIKQYGQEIVPPVGDLNVHLRRREGASLVTAISDY